MITLVVMQLSSESTMHACCGMHRHFIALQLLLAACTNAVLLNKRDVIISIGIDNTVYCII